MNQKSGDYWDMGHNRGRVQMFLTEALGSREFKFQVSVMVLPKGVLMADGQDRMMVNRCSCGELNVHTVTATFQLCLN